MVTKAPASDNGTLIAAISVGPPRRRNSNITSTTRATLISRVISISWIEERVVTVRSNSGLDVHVGRQPGRQLRQACLDRVHRGQGIGAGALADAQHHRALAVQPCGLVHVLGAVVHMRHVAQAHRLAVAFGDHHVRRNRMAVCSWSLACTMSWRWPCSMLPSGALTLAARSALRTSSLS